jgi:hypothetical protein
MAATSAVEWADQQRALREAALSPDFEPHFRDVTYRLIVRRELGDDWTSWSWRTAPLPATAGVASIWTLMFDPPLLVAGLAVVVFLCAIVARLRASLVGGSKVAMWLRGTTDAGRPDLVFRVADDAFADGLRPAGAGRVFGDLVPYGTLGLIVEDVIVWPSYPPAQGTIADGRRARRAAARTA